MRKLIVFVASSMLGISLGFCVEQYHNLGAVNLSSATVTGAFTIPSKTVAQLQALTPKTTGQLVLCSNCNVPFTLVISTGNTLPYQWILSTGTAAK